MPMPMALDHINVYLLEEADGWTLVDTGLNTGTNRAIWEHTVSHRLKGLPLKRLICTHSHYDHAGLAGWIMDRFQIPLLMTHGEYFMLRGFSEPPPDPLPIEEFNFFLRAGMSREQIDRLYSVLRQDTFLPPVPPHYIRIRGGDCLTIGARRWQVLIGEGHSPEHACLYCEEDRILLAGDQLLPRITSNVLVHPVEPEANPLHLWLKSLNRLDGLHPDTLVLPSHQGVFRGLHARVSELHAHHQQQFDLICQALSQQGQQTAFELMTVQFPKRKHPHDDFLALGETIAHLSWLRHQGRIARLTDDTGIHRFNLLN
jgi:glyoxylase-like metal-dependent hydrolase (beta-lactamase superfamily II)